MAVFVVKNTLDLDQNGRGPIQPGSLRDAVRLAKSGDTIKFSRKLQGKTIKLTRVLGIEKDLTIDGRDAPNLSIDGRGKNVLFSLNGEGRDFSIHSLTLQNAFHISNGAAIRAKDPRAKVVVENVEFRNNTAGYGAGVWARAGSDVKVNNSRFYNNRATIKNDTAAGAISVFDRSKLRVKGSQFIGNQGFAGGAVGSIFTETEVTDSVFKENKSVLYSGALHIDGASIPNEERYYKGTKKRDPIGKAITVRNNKFENNRSDGHGGGVGIWGYDQDFVTIASNDFFGNVVTKNRLGDARGGGLRVSGKNVVIKDSRFIGNQSSDEGGAIWHQGQSDARISNTLFLKNEAAAKGGAIFNHQWNGPGAEIVNSTFKYNKASQGGGAIYKNKDRPLEISGSKFEGNGSESIAGGISNVIRRSPGTGATGEDLGYTPPQKSMGSAPIEQDRVSPSPSIPSFRKPFSPQALVAQIDFDRGRGKTALDRASAYGDNNVFLRSSGDWTEGIKGTAAASFDGEKSAAIINNSKAINSETQERTVSFWFNAKETNDGEKKQILYKEGAEIRGLNVYLDDGLLYVGGWNTPNSESGWEGTWLKTQNVTEDKWHHVAVVLDGDEKVQNGALKAFVDGEQIGAGKGSQLWDHSGAVSLGSAYDGTRFHDGLSPGSQHRFTGAIDNLNIYNSALGTGQIESLSEL